MNSMTSGMGLLDYVVKHGWIQCIVTLFFSFNFFFKFFLLFYFKKNFSIFVIIYLEGRKFKTKII
jgi:hypothetical protein